MILSIDNLTIPETLSGNAELFNTDSLRRTVSMRLIRKSSSAEKWRVTLDYEGRAILPALRLDLYAKCREMRGTPKPVTFISPFDGETYAVTMLCVKPFPPKLIHISQSVPYFYANCGAVFEEI